MNGCDISFTTHDPQSYFELHADIYEQISKKYLNQRHSIDNKKAVAKNMRLPFDLFMILD